MDEQELDKLLDDASRRWRMPVDPPLDAIWSAVEAEAFQQPAHQRTPGWGMVGIAAALALIVGAAGGGYAVHRGIVPPPPPTTGLPAVQASTMPDNDPNQRAMGELLGRTAVLLAALPGDGKSAPLDPQISSEGARLLSTTRILLDSPVGSDARLRNLLQDLETVLAQVARLGATGIASQ